MSDSELFFSLLRISAAQVLRAAGLTTAKLSVVDAFTDILARYIILLGTTTRDFAESAGRVHADLDDVRLALEHVGLVRPLNVFNDPFDEDTRGVDNLVEWFRGPQAAEMRRVAGFGSTSSTSTTAAVGASAGVVGMMARGQQQPGEVEAGVKNEEWLAALKRLSEKRGKES